jgi:16S rRNA (adenine1518-N6/adenine1519-N6)-dimethyltransferase
VGAERSSRVGRQNRVEPRSNRSGRGRPGEPKQRPTNELRALLDRFGLRPQKGFGQSFLREERFLDRIVAASDLSPEDLVVEVGPGLGGLTRRLAAAAGEVIAVEIDRGIVSALETILADDPNRAKIHLVEADVLKLDPAELTGGRPYKIVANLPYYVTSPILRRFLETTEHRPRLLVVMVQREVAERMLARPGDMNLLAVMAQYYGRPRVVTLVPAQAFYPTPKVDSAVVRIDVHERPPIDVDREKLFRVVHAGFAQPRKQLHNALSQQLWLQPGVGPDVMRAAGVEPTRRPQTITLQEWGEITRELAARELV